MPILGIRWLVRLPQNIVWWILNLAVFVKSPICQIKHLPKFPAIQYVPLIILLAVESGGYSSW